MARLRTIKPEFWTSEQIVSCSIHARLLFIGMLNFCDDYGIHPASYLRLKMEVFPNDQFSTEDIKQWVYELLEQKLIFEYEVDNSHYWMVTGWEKHQKVEKRTTKYPFPPTLENKSGSAPRLLPEYSPTPPLTLHDREERRGEEKRREDINNISSEQKKESSSLCEIIEDEICIIKIPLVGGAEFSVTEKHMIEFKALFPSIDALKELRAMRGWAIGNKTRRKTLRGILRHIMAWLSKAQDNLSKIPQNSFSSFPKYETLAERNKKAVAEYLKDFKEETYDD